MQPANFQSTIFSFTCANFRNGSIGNRLGAAGTQTSWKRGIGLLTAGRQQDVGQRPEDAAKCNAD